MCGVTAPLRFASFHTNFERSVSRGMPVRVATCFPHAGARKVDVKLTLDAGRVQLRIRDYGVGIPEDKLKIFRRGGFDVGVGLAGMRERVRDLNGALEITSK